MVLKNGTAKFAVSWGYWQPAYYAETQLLKHSSYDFS
jgi:hypothetical protein